jgi:hypothetical protein
MVGFCFGVMRFGEKPFGSTSSRFWKRQRTEIVTIAA